PELSAPHEGVADGEPVDEPGAGGRQIEGAAAWHGADLPLHERRGGGERVVAGDRPEDDAVDGGRIDARLLAGGERRLGGEVARGQRRVQDVALADAGALDDPGVGGVDHLGHVGVGQDLRGDAASGTYDAARYHEMASAPGAGGSGVSVSHRKAWRATAFVSS